MKKLLFVVLVFGLVACSGNENNGNGNNGSIPTSDPIVNNSYIKSDNNYTISDIRSGGDVSADEITDIEGYDGKSGYNVYFKVNGVEAIQKVNVYNKGSNIAFIYFSKDKRDDLSYTFQDNVTFNSISDRSCSIEVNGNKMTTTNYCGNREGEVVNKILKAIEHKTYFDY